jgi:4-amino-4-deoxy-L-arabinose transferase-like glycosyltransferase
MRDRLVSLILFVLVSSVYYATSAGLTSSNDGSHYALLRAMVDEGRFSIESYAHFAEGNDLSIRDEVIYSDRPPGTALLGAPFYWAGGFLPRPIRDLPTRHDEGNPRLAYLLMLPALAGAGAVVILFRLLRGYDLSLFAALTASLAFAFGTTNWKYGGVLFSHSLSAFLILSAVALVIRAGRAGELRWGTGLLLGLALGLAALVDYSSAVFVVIVGVYLFASLRRALFSGEHWWIGVLLLAGGALIPIGLLLGYNAANFGGPFATSYRYAINYPWASSLTTTFDVPFRQGLPGMLWYGQDALGEENQGLFLLMPVALLGLAGVGRYFKRARGESIFVVGLFAAALLIFARHHTFSGFTADGRYLMPFLGLWFVPVGFALEWIEAIKAPAWKTAALFVAYGLLFLSVRNMLAHIAFSYNYHLDPGLVARRASTPANWAYMLGSVFVNWQNIPLLWLVEGIGVGMIVAGSNLRLKGD